MSEKKQRDPRNNPKVGDVIEQTKTGIRIYVTGIDNDNHISWTEKSIKTGKSIGSNRWTLKGWIAIVANDSNVINIAE